MQFSSDHFFFSTCNGLAVNCPRSQQALLSVQMLRVFWRLTSLVISFGAFTRFSWDFAGFTLYIGTPSSMSLPPSRKRRTRCRLTKTLQEGS
jgi:hypothetical protein